MIQIQRLEGFYWVAFTGGYARAARAFPYPITQPAVHQQVKKLERELDITLFERVGIDHNIGRSTEFSVLHKVPRMFLLHHLPFIVGQVA